MRLAPILPLVLALLAGCGRAATPTPDVAPGTGPATRAAAQTKRGTTLTGSHGGRAYHLFVPAGLRGPRPLVVMLHGCTQDPADFATGTRMNAIAARERFYVLYPQQTREDQVKACWPFYEPLHQVRGLGAAHDIVGMVEKVRRSHDVDANAIHAAGLSAGGAYTAVLAALYPDVFASVGVHSGLAFGVATTVAAAKLAMKVGGPPPEITGGLAYLAMGTRRRVVPTLVFQGDADEVVAPVNGEQVTTQALVMNDWASDGLRNGDVDTRPDGTEAGRVDGGHRFTRTWFHDAAGHVVVERVAVAGMGHAWSGGDARGTYTDPLGPDASAMMWAFFKAHRR